MEAGIQVSSLKPILKNEEQVRQAFGKIAEMGCALIQLQWVDPAVPTETIAELAEQAGLRSVSTQDLYEKVLQNEAYYIRLNHQTGGRWVCISRIPERLRRAEKMKACVEEFRALSDRLEKEQLQLCFHPVSSDYEALDGVIPVDFLLEHMPELPICLDLYHLNRNGYNMTEWIGKHAGRVCMVHFKDEKAGQLVPAGQGDTDWTGVVQACERAGAAYGFVEQESWTRDPFECLNEAYQWLKSQLTIPRDAKRDNERTCRG